MTVDDYFNEYPDKDTYNFKTKNKLNPYNAIMMKKGGIIPYKKEYESGGYALGESYDMTDDELEELKKQGYTFDIE